MRLLQWNIYTFNVVKKKTQLVKRFWHWFFYLFFFFFYRRGADDCFTVWGDVVRRLRWIWYLPIYRVHTQMHTRNTGVRIGKIRIAIQRQRYDILRYIVCLFFLQIFSSDRGCRNISAAPLFWRQESCLVFFFKRSNSFRTFIFI